MLDWDAVRAAWSDLAATSLGKEGVLQSEPMKSLDAVRACLGSVEEWMSLRTAGFEPPLGGIYDIREALVSARQGGILEPPTLTLCAQTLQSLRALEVACHEHADVAPRLSDIGSHIVFDDHVASELLAAFDETGALCGETYPTLGALRTNLADLHLSIRATLDTLIQDSSIQDILQDSFWTKRSDRYVLPIKSHAKRWDLGIVHGMSGSGQTAYIEPTKIVELNNKLRVLEGTLRAEEHAILRGLSQRLGLAADEVLNALDIAKRLDVIHARARLAVALNGSKPLVEQEGVVQLVAARHPILCLREIDVVEQDLTLDRARPALVISGPNAGGKTVALKTIGACVLLVQHGCFVPAKEGSRVDLFDQVHALMGDQQTVEDDLSTFSAHLKQLMEMIEQAQPGHLLLLDELCRGTDPEQGAALAIALLEHFVLSQTRVVVTTHFATLKAKASADPRFAISAMHYEHGQPTYRILEGATGESHTLATAERMGFPDHIVKQAHSLMGDKAHQLTQALEAIEVTRNTLETQRTSLEAERKELQELKTHVEARERQLKEQRDALIERGAEAYLKRLNAAEKAIGQVVADLQRAPSPKRATAARTTLQTMRPLGHVQAPQTPKEVFFDVGDTVRIVSVGQPGTVEKVKGDQCVVKLDRGPRVTVKRHELERRALPKQEAKQPNFQQKKKAKSKGVDPMLALRLPNNTLDLRGQRVDDAMEACEQYFDSALLASEDAVFVLHGHGTGALKTHLRSWFSKSHYVKTWKPAQADQGGDAYTVVVLKSV